MWQRFTPNARKTVFYAQDEAQRMSDGYVSTEHLLLGLLRDSDTTCCRVLVEMKCDIPSIDRAVRKLVPHNARPISHDMTLNPRAKRVIDLAYAQSNSLANSFIGTEHLLLGLIQERDGLAGQVLANLGVDFVAARSTIASFQEAHPRPKEDLPPIDIRLAALRASSEEAVLHHPRDTPVVAYLGRLIRDKEVVLNVDSFALRSLLFAEFPDRAKEINLIFLVALLDAPSPTPVMEEMGSSHAKEVIAARIRNEFTIYPHAANWAVEAWIWALSNQEPSS